MFRMERDGKMGVQLDVSNGYVGRLEVVEGPTAVASSRTRKGHGSRRKDCCLGFE
jgi:hypothetical protein